jgi:hypothetical protein
MIKNLGIISQAIKNAEIEAEKEFSKQLQLIETDIIGNVQSGRDYEGKPFRQYADSTKDFRAKQKLQTSPVNLMMTGGMLKAISSEVKNKNQGRIFIKNQTQRGFKGAPAGNSITKALNVMRLGFNFFGVSEKNLKKLEDAVTKAYLKGAKK